MSALSRKLWRGARAARHNSAFSSGFQAALFTAQMLIRVAFLGAV